MPIQNTACPHCGERWNFQEIQEQECFTCGFPNPLDTDEDDDEKDDLVTKNAPENHVFDPKLKGKNNVKR